MPFLSSYFLLDLFQENNASCDKYISAIAFFTETLEEFEERDMLILVNNSSLKPAGAVNVIFCSGWKT